MGKGKQRKLAPGKVPAKQEPLTDEERAVVADYLAGSAQANLGDLLEQHVTDEDRAIWAAFYKGLRVGAPVQRAGSPPTTPPSCQTCQNWLQRSQYGEGKVERGWCRALPPTSTGWPQSYGDDWCFSHAPGVAPSTPGPREAQA